MSSRETERPRNRWDEVAARIALVQPAVGVEVGVWRGDLSDRLLSARPLLRLYLVDPWTDASQGSRLAGKCRAADAMESVRRICEHHGGRGMMVRKTSVEAAAWLPDGSLDFAFIDAKHNYHSVREDIAAWLPKVTPGGWIGGHDYCERFSGCMRAVDEAFGDRVELGADDTWFVGV